MPNSKASRIAEILQSLAYRDFEICGESIYITDYDGGRLANEREVSINVERQSEQHVLLHHGVSSEEQGVGDDWCPECTRELFSNQFGPSADLLAELEKFSDGFKKVARKESATTMLMRVLAFLDENHDHDMRAATAAVRIREGLGQNAEDSEKRLADWTWDSDRVTDFYADWLGSRFRGIVDRAERLNAISIRVSVNDTVQRYLVEASRCYILGQYISCLVVSRAAIEIALGDFLERNGASEELRKLQQARQDGLSGRIRIAEKLPKWKLKFTLGMAKEVKYWADKALHEKDVGPEKCKDLFFKARGVLRDLYV